VDIMRLVVSIAVVRALVNPDYRSLRRFGRV
jgi:hypothetical protein